MLTIRIEPALPLASSTTAVVEYEGFSAVTAIDLDPAIAVNELRSALSAGPFRMVVEEAAHGGPEGAVLVDVREPALFAAQWEGLRFEPSLRDRPVVRIAEGDAARALVPVDLPVDLLFGSLRVNEDQPVPADPGAMRYFRVTRTAPATVDVLMRICAGAAFDVVHLRGAAEWRDGQGVLLCAYGPPLDHRALATLTVEPAARLLILEVSGPDPGPALDLAHRALRMDGPSIVVLSTAPTEEPSEAQQIYLDVVHDIDLDSVIAARQRAGGYAALLRHHGGEHQIRISSSLPSLFADLSDYHTAAGRLLTRLEARGRFAAERGILPDQDVHRLGDVARAVEDLDAWRGMTLDYGRESGAWVPLTDAATGLTDMRAALPELSHTQRVVNVWFADDDRNVPSTHALMASRRYFLAVHIGLALSQSINRSPAGFPDDPLPFEPGEGVDITVVVFSRDLQAESTQHTLLLPPPPGESDVLRIPVTTPSRLGQSTARLCLYHKHQLLQSLRITVTVAESEGMPGVQDAVTDFVLSGSLDHVDDLEPRALSIVVNDDPSGSHTIGVVGAGEPRSLNLSDNEMGSKARAAREALQAICSTFKRDGTPDRYRFEPDNRGRPDAVLDEIRALARLGWTLYADMVVGKDWEFQDELEERLRRPTTIQIAVTASATRAFPWALIYDQPLTSDPRNTLCEEFQRGIIRGGPAGWVDRLTCFTTRCSSADDPNVICPSGFWGFRHVVEQPLSTQRRSRGAVKDAASPVVQDVPRVIAAPHGTNMLMAVSEDLRQLRNHQADVEAIRSYDTAVRSDRFQIGTVLKRPDLHVVYFYCHGGREKTDVWLGVGHKQRLLPSDLVTWRVRWAGTHPLVFINGCETVDVTPDDLASFLDALAFSRASGVIGVEITIPEKLASRFAIDFLSTLTTGNSVGELVRAGRRRLLEIGNPLGLAYTPYCVADLRLDTLAR
ncbi:CHAT domain-containing protein [Geodermatophilus sp. SYSU D00867]